MKRVFLCLLAIVVLCLSSSPPLHAVASSDEGLLALSVAPAIAEIFVTPGVPQKKTVTLVNNTDEALLVSARTNRFIPFEDVAPAAQGTFNVPSWITIDQPDFILQPRQPRQVTLTVSSPKHAEPGGHYATVYFQPLRPANGIKKNTAYIGSKVGLHLFLVVKGNITQDLRIVSLEIPAIQQHGPVAMRLSLENKGNIHLMPAGHIEIREKADKVIAKLPLPPTLVLPYTTKVISLPWNTKERVGRFEARANVVYGQEHTVLKSPKTSFWILPWLPAGIILFTAVGGGLFFWRTRKRWVRVFRVLMGGTDAIIKGN